jgi:putative peptidoglycan lipid II flippase
MSGTDTNFGEVATAQTAVGATQVSKGKTREMSKRTTVLAVGTTLSRLTGFIRIQALAAALGFTFLSDAYTLANNTPNIIYELVLGGILSATLIPVFVSLQNHSDEDLKEGSSAVIGVAGVVLIAVTAVFMISAPFIIHAYTVGNHKADVVALRNVGAFLLVFFAPQVLFYGFITIATALLNTKRRFAAPAFAPMVNNIIVIVMFYMFRSLFHSQNVVKASHDRQPLIYLGLLTTAGVLGMALALAPSLTRAHISLRPSWNPKHPAVKRVLSLSGWTLGFVIANQIALLVVLALASQQEGGPTAYTVAYIFFLLPHGIFSVSIMTAMQPELADAWARRDLKQFRHDASTAIRLILLVVVPAAILYVTLASPIIHLTLDYGAARHSDTSLVSGALAMIAIGLPAFSVYLFLISCFQALQDTKTAFYVYLVENGINIVVALMVYQKYGVKGLAFAFAIAYIVAAILALVVINRRVGNFYKPIIASLTRIVLAGIAMVAVIEIVEHALSNADQVPFVIVACCTAVGIPTYFAFGKLLGLSEWNYFMRGPLARFAKKEAK